MPMKLLDADTFRDGAKSGQAPEGTLFKFATTDPQTVDGATRTKRFVFSDATVDHSGDSIDPKGWDLSVFKRNPVALFSHMSWDPPIGRASNVSVQGDKLVGDIEFATAEVYDFADTIYRLVDGGFLKAVSVGFMPKSWAFSSDKDRPYGIDFKSQQLLEISVCPVPCNPNALGEARSIGVDTRPLADWAEKVLDSGDTVFLPRKELEGLRVQAKGSEPRRYYIQAASDLSADAAERVREAVKRWQADQSEVLILPNGVELRALDVEATAPAVVAAESHALAEESTEAKSELEAALDAILTPERIEQIDQGAEKVQALKTALTKAGRRISAANKAKLQEAMDMSAAHHEAMTTCIMSVIGNGEDNDDDPDGDLDDAPPGPTEVPPGSTVLEEDKYLSAEERRLKEVQALKASLPQVD